MNKKIKLITLLSLIVLFSSPISNALAIAVNDGVTVVNESSTSKKNKKYSIKSVIKKNQAMHSFPAASGPGTDTVSDLDFNSNEDGDKTLHYSISIDKTGSTGSTAVGDTGTVTVKATALKPFNTLYDNKKVFLNTINGMFVIPQENDGALKMVGSPSLSLVLKSQNNKSVNVPQASTKNHDYIEGLLHNKSYGNLPNYDLVATALVDQFINGSHTVGKTYTGQGTAPQIAWDNDMQAGDYFEFKYNFEITDKALNMNTEDIRAYAGTWDNDKAVFGDWVSAQLPGDAISNLSITPDKTVFDEEVKGGLDSLAIDMSGKYAGDDQGKVSYEIFNGSSSDIVGHEKPDTDAVSVATDANTGTYKATVNSEGKFKAGTNTVRFYLTGSDGTVVFVDVTVNITVSNQKPEVTDVRLNPTSMFKKEEQDINVTGKYLDPDNDNVSLSYQIDDGEEKKVDKYQNVKQSLPTIKARSIIQKKKKLKLLSNYLADGVQQQLPFAGDEASIDIDANGGKLTYGISYEKTGNPNQTAIGDEVIVKTRITAVTPQTNKINNKDVFMNMVNSAFIFPYAIKADGTDNPLTDESDNGGAGTGEMHSADGSKKAEVNLWQFGDGSFDADPDNTNGMQAMWDVSNMAGGSFGSLPDFSLKGTPTFNSQSGITLYDSTQYQDVGGKVKPYTKAPGSNPVSSVPVTVPYIAQQNDMQAGDYFEFTFKYKVNEKADGIDTDKLKFYSGIYDSADPNFKIFGHYIDTSLPGDTISNTSISADKSSYSDEVTASDLPNYSVPLTGTYVDGSKGNPQFSYEVLPGRSDEITGHQTPGGDAVSFTGSDSKYSVDAKGKFQYGDNTVRLFIVSGSTTSYCDVEVNLTQKLEPSNFDFDISAADLKSLDVGKHVVHVFATDSNQAKSDDVENISTGQFEILPPQAGLEVPDTLTFKEITVGSSRQLDLRDAGWDQIKMTGGLDVTVQQTAPWVVDGSSKTLNPIEMVSSDDEFNNHRGTPIDTAAVPVKFKADGTLDWSDQFGLLQPIGTDNLAGGYSTELTWTITDAAK